VSRRGDKKPRKRPKKRPKRLKVQHHKKREPRRKVQ
jgi:hypothetical protein